MTQGLAGKDCDMGAAGAAGAGAGASVTVPHERTSVRVVRHAMADQLEAAGVTADERNDAMLVLSELVTNAVMHAAPLPSGQIAVCWEVRDDLLHIEITDGGAGTRPHARVTDLSALGGRGLDIVRNVSAQWGVTEGDGRVTVWAEVPRTGQDAVASGIPPAEGKRTLSG